MNLADPKRGIRRDTTNLLNNSLASDRQGTATVDVDDLVGPVPDTAQIAQIDCTGIRAIRIVAQARNTTGRLRVYGSCGNDPVIPMPEGAIGSWAIPWNPNPLIDRGVSIVIEYPPTWITIEGLINAAGQPVSRITVSWILIPFDVMQEPRT